MFKAAYDTKFYRAVRDALHAEVDSWQSSQPSSETLGKIDALWRNVDELEPISRDADVLTFSNDIGGFDSTSFVSIEQLASSGRR